MGASVLRISSRICKSYPISSITMATLFPSSAPLLALTCGFPRSRLYQVVCNLYVSSGGINIVAVSVQVRRYNEYPATITAANRSSMNIHLPKDILFECEPLFFDFFFEYFIFFFTLISHRHPITRAYAKTALLVDFSCFHIFLKIFQLFNRSIALFS